MYFDFDEDRPDTPRVSAAISWREGVLLSVNFHLLMVIGLILQPRLFPVDRDAALARAWAFAERFEQDQERMRFVLVEPRVDTTAPAAPDRADLSDKDRMARAPERAPDPKNESPLALGDTPERVEELPTPLARGEGPAPEPAAGEEAQNHPPAEPEPQRPESEPALQMPAPPPPQIAANGSSGRAPTPGGSLGDALRNLQRYVQMYDNPQGGGGQF